MARVKRGVTTHARHKKVLDLAKGYRGRSSKAYRIALEKVEKALRYAYRDRRNKKRDFRALWIQRINAGAREHGLTYSQFIHGVKLAGLELDRKVLSDLAIREPEAFAAIVATVQAALATAPPAAEAVSFDDRYADPSNNCVAGGFPRAWGCRPSPWERGHSGAIYQGSSLGPAAWL